MSRLKSAFALLTLTLATCPGLADRALAQPGISSDLRFVQDHGDVPVTDPALSQAIRAVIVDQMAAFRRDDAVAAFNDASPFIQGRFQQPDIFLQMVRSGYAPVYRPHQVEFRDLVEAPSGLEQRVFVMGPDGRAYLAHYQMQRQSDGSWKINGCTLEPLGDQTT
jgi:ketosteroid isomerase-like protein